MRFKKFIFFLILFSFSLFSSFALQQSQNSNSLRETFFCGDNICNVGENNLNCYQDCSIKSINYHANFDSVNNPIKLYSNLDNQIELYIENKEDKEINFNLSYGNIINYFTNKTNLKKEFKLAPFEKKEIIIPLKIIKGKFKDEQIYNKLFYFDILLTLDSNKVVNFPFKVETYPSYDLSKIKLNFLDNTVPTFNELVLLLDFTDFNKFNKIHNFNVDLYLINSKNKSYYLGNYLSNKDLNDITLIPFGIFNNSKNFTFQKGLYTLDLNFHINNVNLNRKFKFEYKPIFWNADRLLMLALVLVSLFFLGSFLYAFLKYNYYKLKKSRYITPDLSKIPKAGPRSMLIGKIGGIDKKAYLNVDDLLTHCLVAGSTGAGKSVTSSVLVEGVLDKNIPVVVFDPTAQWTGFLAQNKDDKVLKFFKNFNMSENDAKSYKGIIYDVKSPKIDLDFKDYMNPGEITVFNLADLKAGDYGFAVQGIVKTIFDMSWEESPELKMLIVFDEVHRLLNPTEDKSGYLSLEKAAREFRKWGIGVLMVSQVSADFKEALQGNVLTEVQLNTKSMSDISKVKTKYGELYSERITRMNIGTGLIQNPHYNEGHPWFVNIKPPVHSPHKLSDDLLAKYTKYSSFLKNMELFINKIESVGVNTSDIKMDLKLAKNKLKEGRFRMVEIYVESLESFVKEHKGALRCK